MEYSLTSFSIEEIRLIVSNIKYYDLEKVNEYKEQVINDIIADNKNTIPSNGNNYFETYFHELMYEEFNCTSRLLNEYTYREPSEVPSEVWQEWEKKYYDMCMKEYDFDFMLEHYITPDLCMELTELFINWEKVLEDFSLE